MTGNITIIRADWATVCGRIAFRLNFPPCDQYIVSVGDGLRIAKIEGNMEYAWEHSTVLPWQRVFRDEVLEIIRQGDTAMWDWGRFMTTWEAWADGWDKSRKEFERR